MFADCPQDYVTYESGPRKVDLHGVGNTGQHGSAWCMSGRLKRLAYSRIDLSLLQRQSTSQEKHGRLRHFPASVNLGPGDRRLCMRLVLVSFTTAALYSAIIIIMRHSTIDLSLLHLKRASEPPDIFLLDARAPRDRILHEVYKLVLVSFTLISHIVSCMLH